MKKLKFQGAVDTTADPSRRAYLQTLGILGLGGSLLAPIAIPAASALGFPLRRNAERKPTQLVKVGRLSRLQRDAPVRLDVVAERVDAWNRFPPARIGSIWAVRRPERRVVFSTICPHLGCAVDFDAGSANFKCPCHASAFSLDGQVLAGPAPRALDELETQVDGDELLVHYQRFRVGTPDKQVV